MDEVPLERLRIGDGRTEEMAGVLAWKQQSRVTTGFRPSTGHQNRGGIVNYQITCESGLGCWVRVCGLLRSY
jgi:hypothetical protein